MTVMMKINIMTIKKKKEKEKKKRIGQRPKSISNQCYRNVQLPWAFYNFRMEPMGSSLVNCSLQKLQGAWVQALDAVSCGSVWVDKC